MSLVVLDSAQLHLGGRAIFTDLGLRIGDGDRIGVIGANGSGKTTLLRVLAGEQSLDGGTLQVTRGVRIGYLPQDIEVTGGKQLLDFVLSSVPGREEQGRRLAEAEAELERLSEGGADPAGEEMMELAGRIADAHERLDHFERTFSEPQAMRILGGLGFETADHHRDLRELSGGWKMRAVLAALLFQQPDLLLLDEPTNHLDMPSVSWFSEFLKRYKRAFLLISHDREFLNEQVGNVVSFEPEGVRAYEGNLDSYERRRAEEEEVRENKAKNLARERERLERFVERFRAQANKAKAVQSRVKALEKMDEVETFQRRAVMRVSFEPTGRTVREVLRAENVDKAFGDKVLFSGLDLAVERGDRIGIIGTNGSGKTTLLRMLAGELSPDGGRIRPGTGVQVGYYAQHHADSLQPGLSAYDEVASVNPGATQTRVRAILGAFLFSGDDVDKKIGVLSGGERARVALAKLLAHPGHVLLMDEPTNHLDLESSESLAASLAEFDGSLVIVSHNRSLIRKVATTIWNVADGTVEPYPGTLDEYMDSVRRRWAEGDDASAASAASAPASDPVSRSRGGDRERKRREAERRQRRAKLVAPIERRIEKLETRVSELEAAQSERSELLSDPAVYDDEPRRVELMRALQADQSEIDELTAAWEAAHEELERAESELNG